MNPSAGYASTVKSPPGGGRRGPKTFYRRQLPETCTALSSQEGRAIFASALSNNGLKTFFPLIEQFTTQSEPAFCGISTLVMVLNALSVDPRRTWKGPWRWYEENMLNCCMDLEEVKATGITFKTFICLAKCQGLTFDAHLGSESSLEEFRHAVRTACVGEAADDVEKKFLVVSYCRRTVGQTGSGHFSPVAAYDEASDSVLILDTARFKYGAHWMSLELLYEALQPIDPDTNKSRGYVLLSHEVYDDMYSAQMPFSILLRSANAQSPVRREYKAYLENRKGDLPISLDDVVKYWTKDGKDLKFVWKMMEAQLSPVDDDEKKCVASIRALLKKLIANWDGVAGISDTLWLEKEKCGEECFNSQRKVSLSTMEAMYIVFLASVPPDVRREVIFSIATDDDSISDTTRNQLLCEAELVQYAIDVSDAIE